MTAFFGLLRIFRTDTRSPLERTILSIATAILFATVAWSYVDTNVAPSKEQALSAIEILEHRLLSPEAEGAARTVVKFADKSESVMITIGEPTMPWTVETWKLPEDVETSTQSLLFATYVAGNIKSQLSVGKPIDDPYAGWLTVLVAYHQLQAKVKFTSPSLDQLEEMRVKNSLRAHAEKVLKEGDQPPAQKNLE